jgi:hypothetical protein
MARTLRSEPYTTVLASAGRRGDREGTDDANGEGRFDAAE